jgi:hypothetical protein
MSKLKKLDDVGFPDNLHRTGPHARKDQQGKEQTCHKKNKIGLYRFASY